MCSSLLVVSANAYVSSGTPTVSTEVSSTSLMDSEDSVYRISGNGRTKEDEGEDHFGIVRGSVTFDIPSSVWASSQNTLSLEVFIDLTLIPTVDGINSKYAYFDVAVNKSGEVTGNEKLGALAGTFYVYGLASNAVQKWIPLTLDLSDYDADTCDSITIYYFNDSLLENIALNTAAGSVYFRNVKMNTSADKMIIPATYAAQASINMVVQNTASLASTVYQGRTCWNYTFQTSSRILIQGADIDINRYNYLLINYYCEDATVADGNNQFQIKTFSSSSVWSNNFLTTSHKIQTGSWKTAVLELPGPTLGTDGSTTSDGFYLQINVPGAARNVCNGTIYISSMILSNTSTTKDDTLDTTPVSSEDVEITATSLGNDVYKISGNGKTKAEEGDDYYGIVRGEVSFEIPATVWSNLETELYLEAYIDMDSIPSVDGVRGKYIHFDATVWKDGVVQGTEKIGIQAGALTAYGIDPDGVRTWIPLTLDLSDYDADTCDTITIYYFNPSMLENIPVGAGKGEVYFRNVQMTSDSVREMTPYSYPMAGPLITLGSGETMTRTTYDGKTCWRYDFKAGARTLIHGADVDPDRYNYLLITYYCPDGQAIADGVNQFQIKTYSESGTWGPGFFATEDKIQTGAWKTAVLGIVDTTFTDGFYLQMNASGSAKNKSDGTIYIASMILAKTQDVSTDAYEVDFCDFSETPFSLDAFGIQRSITPYKNGNGDDAQSIRFVGLMNATVSNLTNLTNVGFEIEITLSDRAGKVVKTGTAVYTSIYAGIGDAGETITAEDNGGDYFVALTLSDVPIGEEIAFRVIPFVTDISGTKWYGSAANAVVLSTGAFEGES